MRLQLNCAVPVRPRSSSRSTNTYVYLDDTEESERLPFSYLFVTIAIDRVERAQLFQTGPKQSDLAFPRIVSDAEINSYRSDWQTQASYVLHVKSTSSEVDRQTSNCERKISTYSVGTDNRGTTDLFENWNFPCQFSFQTWLLGLVVSDNSTIGDSTIEDVSEVSETNSNLDADSGDQVSQLQTLFPYTNLQTLRRISPPSSLLRLPLR
ncbi:hypothetical protein K0M31_000621 [Melipona bicolor]|uniref:Uncharacterized protein n=1 Tax=Melipona bicolor TaxID=60889 RepID=A0AA40KX78_9HYME|nr:hypothetical protein K0M31_000621 [Melipona bicolor]